MSRPVFPAVVDQHAREAAFLWLLRDGAVRAPHYDLADLEALDERVEANLDGLLGAGDAGWEACARGLAAPEGGEVFAATVVALERGDLRGVAAVIDAAGASPPLSRGLVSALGWVSFDTAARTIRALLAPRGPAALRRLGIAACAAHRRDPGPALPDALLDPDAALRARALRAVGELGRADLRADLRRALEDEDASCRQWAAWSGVMLGAEDRAPIRALWRNAAAGGPRAALSCVTAVLADDKETSAERLLELGAEPARARTVLAGVAALGDPALMPWVLERMAEPRLARAAGEAFSAITGADLRAEKLKGEPPKGFRSGPTDDPRDEDVAMDPDEDLLWPDPEATARAWERRRPAFRDGARYLLGLPVTAPWLDRILARGPQRRRAAAAIELALRAPERRLFEVRAPARRQRRALEGA
ncbi:MAG: TIGR02270 family protein [Polyangiaceae bacterium]|nr:TIGR02270 family protein [Polyangiaceae bacterium]